MRKKIAATAAAALAALALAGCSQSSVEEAVKVPTEFPFPSIQAEAGEPAEGSEKDAQAPSGAASASKSEAASGSSAKPSAGSTSGGSSGSTATAPSGGSSGGSSGASSGGSSSSKPAEEQKPQAHEHSWTHHPAEYYDQPVYAERIVCSCGQVFSAQSSWSSHNQALVAKDPESGHSYSVRDVQVGTERVQTSAEYWSCGCGATK